MQKSIYTLFILLLIGLITSSYALDKRASKKQEPKTNQKTNEDKKAQDTIKKSKFISNIEIELDSSFAFKGKFKPYKQNAHASYYADRFHNKRTASGKLYNMNKLTAAHKKLPFGTIVKVTNQSNGKTVIVEITDRGPFIKGREIDLSKKAFFSIAGSKNHGRVIVNMEVLQK